MLLPNIQVDFNEEVYTLALFEIENRVISMGGNMLSFYGFPELDRTIGNALPTDIIRETSYDIEYLGQYIGENEPKLLPDQALSVLDNSTMC